MLSQALFEAFRPRTLTEFWSLSRIFWPLASCQSLRRAIVGLCCIVRDLRMLGAPQPRRYDALTPREQRFEANKVMSWVPTPDSALRRVGGRKRERAREREREGERERERERGREGERERDQLALNPNASTSTLNLAVFCNMLSLHHTYDSSVGCIPRHVGGMCIFMFRSCSALCLELLSGGAKPSELGASTQNKAKIIRR